MLHRFFVMTLMMVASTAFSQERGRIVIVGNGEASAAPEYAQVQVTVTSICYETSKAAKDANAVLANKLLTVLRTFASDPRSSVTASGGPNLRQTETVQDGERVKIICQLKWRATNVLTIRTPDLQSLADLQDQLLTTIDQTAASQPLPDQTAQSFAELSQPSFRLYDETLVILRSTAQGKAFTDAKTQFKALTADCPLEDVRLTAIKPPRENVYYQPRDAGMHSGTFETPIIPEKISISTSWQFEWSFLANQACVRKRGLTGPTGVSVGY